MTVYDPDDNSLASCELDVCACGRRNWEHSTRELLDCLRRELLHAAVRCHLDDRRN